MFESDSQLAEQARTLVGQMTPAEKLRLLAGDLDLYRDLVLGTASPTGDTTTQPSQARFPFLWSAASLPRLGLPGLFFVDGPRGVARGLATCFPVAIARAASFDYTLEERIGEAVGREARAQGANVVLAPCLNLLRHPGWGRAQETYGENSTHIGEMGAAFVRGLQRHVLGCAKHFACNSIEESRFRVDVRVDRAVLAEVYLPHFKRVVEEGVAAVMAAYNRVNGEWCAQNHYLLTTVLKEEWGFRGFVVSDWLFGVRDGMAALAAGLDLEMPCRLFIDRRVAKAVSRGRLPQSRIDDAAERLVLAQLRAAALGDRNNPGSGSLSGLFGGSAGRRGGFDADIPRDPLGDDYGFDVVACAEHRALSREAAVKGIVLLRNEPVPSGTATSGNRLPDLDPPVAQPLLPLDPRRVHHLAVIGRLADTPNVGDHGSSRVTPPYVVTPLAGLRAALEPQGSRVSHDDGSLPDRAAALAAGADIAIIVAGYDYQDEGEYLGTFPPPGFRKLLPRPPLRLLPQVLAAAWAMRRPDAALSSGGDRRSLTLHPDEEDLITKVAAVNPRTVVVLMCGSAVIMERWRRLVPAIVVLWYPGMEGGHALADILFGGCEPTGRLPLAFPTSPDHLPPFDPGAEVVEYGPLHGQPLLDHLGVSAAYPYGFGLTYRLP